MMRNKGLWIKVGLLVLVGVLLWQGAAAKKVTPQPVPTSKAALTVTTTTLQPAHWMQNLTANGSVVAWQEAVIGAEVTGVRIKEVRANVGDRVIKGQVLATLANDTMQASEAEAMAALHESEALLAEAGANAERTRKLAAAGFVSAQQRDQALTNEQSAFARLEVQRARHQASALRLAQQHITAPDEGVISARNATVGTLTQSGAELFRLIRQGRLEWHAELTADELGLIRKGMKVELIAAQGKVVQGVVSALSPSLNPQTRYGQARVSLPADSGLIAGMFARGSFQLGDQAKSVSVLPQSAVMLRDGAGYVFVVEANSQVKERKIAIGRRYGEQIEVQSGLEAGVPVVASGVAFLVAGDRVRVTGVHNVETLTHPNSHSLFDLPPCPQGVSPSDSRCKAATLARQAGEGANGSLREDSVR